MPARFLAILLFFVSLSAIADSDQFWADKQRNYNKCVSEIITEDSDELSVSLNELINTCANPESGPDLGVESLSLLAPKTTQNLIFPDDTSNERSVASLFFSEVISRTSKAINDEWGIDPFAIYTDKTALQGQLALKNYDDNSRINSLSAYSLTIEDGLSFIIHKICQFVAAMYLLILFRRVMLSLFDADNGMQILKTTMKESVPALLCLYLVMPASSSQLPVVGEILVAAFLSGALVASASMQLLVQVLVGVHSPRLFMSTGDVSDYAKLALANEYDKFIHEASDRVVYLDALLSDYMTTKHGSYQGAAWAAALDDRALQKCVTRPNSYWHINYALDSDCKMFASSIKDAMSDQYKVYAATLLADDKLDRYMKVQGLVSRDTDSQIFNGTVARALMTEVYKVADQKKGALCSVIPTLGSLSTQKGEWFCNRFDYAAGVFTDEPVAPDFYNHLSNAAIPWGKSELQAASNKYMSPHIDDAEKQKLLQSIIDAAKPSRDDLIEILQKVDVRDLTLRGVISALWNNLYISSVFVKEIAELEKESFGVYARFFGAVLDTIPMPKYESIQELREAADDQKYKDSNKVIEYQSWLSEKSESEEPSLMLGGLSMITKYTIGISPEACVNDNDGCLSGDVHPMSQISSLINGALTASIGIAFTSAAIELLTGDNAFLDALRWVATSCLVVAVMAIAFGVLPFFLYYLYAQLKAAIRLIVYLIAAPVVILQWFFRKNSDSEYDDSNIFYPKELSGMAMRLFAEQLAISLSVILCMILISFNISILAVMSSTAIDAISGSEPETIMYSATKIITLVMSILVVIAAYIYAAYQTSTLQPYLYDKMTDFIYTGFNLETDKDNEAEMILGLFAPYLGFLGSGHGMKVNLPKRKNGIKEGESSDLQIVGDGDLKVGSGN